MSLEMHCDGCGEEMELSEGISVRSKPTYESLEYCQLCADVWEEGDLEESIREGFDVE